MQWDALTWAGMAILSYAIGGIPTAYVATRAVLHRDIRHLGDRNVGAANVYRSVGPRVGFAVGAIDIAKGAAAVLLVRGLVDSTGMEMMAGAAALAGHNWPIHLRFRGGRGAASAIGVLLAMLPAIAIPIGILTLVILYFTRKAIAALAFFLIALPVFAWLADYSPAVAFYALAIPLMVGLSHFVSTRILPSPMAEEGGSLALPQEC